MKPTIIYRQTALRLLAGLIFLCLPALPVAGQAAPPDKWDGTTIAAQLNRSSTSDTILIATAAELAYFAHQVNNKEAIQLGNQDSIKPDDLDPEGSGFSNFNFALTNNIDLDGKAWTPIGGNNKNAFKGHFDGRGHCVSGLMVSVDGKGADAYAGLFGNAEYSILQNLGVRLAEAGVRATTLNTVYAGGIAGKADTVYCCYVEGPGSVEAVASNNTESKFSYAGGIAGFLFNNPVISHCYATVAVKAAGSEKNHAGGVVGRFVGNNSNNNKLSYTYATGAVEATGGTSNNYAGGICGYVSNLPIEYNLALNKSIKGDEGESNRIIGRKEWNNTFTSNFASPEIPVNGSRVSSDTDLNGADTWPDTFEEDLKGASSGNNKWNATDTWTWTSGYLPQLNIFGNNQPKIEASSAFSLKDLSLDETTGKIYLMYDGKKWLYNKVGSDNPTIPFNGTVTGKGQSPITIVQKTVKRALTFKDMFLTTDGTCLTVEDGVTLPLHLEGKNGLINKGQSGYAIDNKGTLTLTGELLCLSGPASSTIDGNGTITYDSPMMEWQFENPLQAKSFAWETASGQALIECVNEGTTSSVALVVADATKQVRLKVGPSDKTSSPVTQQYHDGNNYTTSFTPQPGQRTVFIGVKDCLCLHLEQPTGGDLTVTDKDKTQLFDGAYVPTGTQLTLLCTPKDNYIFESYLCGPAADNLPDLQGNEVTVGESDLWLSARLRYERPTPPPPPAPVYYTVTLPQVEGATTDPVPGEYEVESWDTFRFYLTIDSAYSQSKPVVTTDRGETLVPRTSDGGYLVKYVRCDVEIFIDGLIKNDPVANEAIAPADALVPQIWAEGSMLCIRMAEALPSAPVRIFTVDGRLHASFASTPGLNRRQLPTGMYIVRVGATARKVIIR